MPQVIAYDEIKIKVTVDDVWNVLIDIPNYPKWWPKIVNLKVLKLTDALFGTEFQARPPGGKSFTCRVINLVPYKEIRLDYFAGIYRGAGVWKLVKKENLIIAGYSVDLEIVDTSIAFLSRKIFIPKLHSMIFKRILFRLSQQVISQKQITQTSLQ